jgi:NADH dehydrogenase [ubiquinone] 1 alpha subcomplex assembly factor 3
MQDGHFLVNHYWISGSIIVFPNRYYMWNISSADEIKPHTLEVMNFVKPRPDYLIIGTGETALSLTDEFYEYFKRLGITVDTCPSFEACSTFNLCVEDNYNVACAMLHPMISQQKDFTGLAPKDAPDSMEP